MHAPTVGSRSVRTGKSRLGLILALLATVIIVVGYLVWRSDHSQQVPIGREGVARALPAADFDALEALHLTAVAQLENGELAKARESFQSLLVQLPDEPAAIQNLAVCAMLGLEADTPTEESLADAETAIGAFLRLRSDSAIGHYLQARYLLKLNEFDPSLDVASEVAGAFQRAEAFDPQNPVYPYERFRTIDPPLDGPMTPEAMDAIERAFTLAPDNVFAQLDFMVALARMGDARVRDVVPAIARTLQPHLEGPTPAANIRRLLTEIEQQLSDYQSEEFQITATRLANNIRPTEICRADSRRIAPNPLEFVVPHLVSVQRAAEPRKAETANAPDLQFMPEMSQISVDGDPLVAVQSIDMNQDMRLDLVLLQRHRVLVWTRGTDGHWVELCTADLDFEAAGMLLADLDRDDRAMLSKVDAAGGPPKPDSDAAAQLQIADPDLLIYGSTGFRVLRNQFDPDSQTRKLELVTPAAEVAEIGSTHQAVLADLDHDGDLDVVLATQRGLRLWSNRGELRFEDISHWSELPNYEGRVGSLVAVDWDRDVDVDILVAGSTPACRGVLENLRHGHFRWRATDWEGWKEAERIALLESDGNVSWDLIASNSNGFQLLRTVTRAPVISPFKSLDREPTALRGESILDIDNDGTLDIVGWQGKQVLVFRGAETATGFGAPLRIDLDSEIESEIENVDFGDLDDDGDLDLVVVTGKGVSLLENRGSNQRAWIAIRLQGRDEEKVGRVNHLAIGSTIEIREPNRYLAQVVTRPLTHFGLGTASPSAIARVIFPNGVPQSVVHPNANQLVQEQQKLLTSCPFLYTWDGDRFVFCTDLLWNAPLGLQAGGGAMIPDRPWEYLKIEGRQLRPQDGQYRLRITEELWEASYFDQVELIAVDHPEGTEIYSNEKVGPPSISEYRIHTVVQRRTPVNATDSKGRDILPLIRAKDGVYCRPFDRTFRQGLAEEHYIELDFGPLSSPSRITLFLTGWIYPTDCNLNVQIAQDPTLRAPVPPSVWVPDEQGDWVESIPFMGFPSGKTKTIAVDLSTAFRADDYRVRIRTSAALRWDEIFFTVDDEPVETRVATARMLRADLRFRGFCEPLEQSPDSPEAFNYHRVHPGPLWPPMRGRFTRYGDVRELLERTDDRLAVFGAGDEIALEFEALPDPPPGWTRDFLLHNTGWEKDCLLNTVTGQTVEPMPFAAMRDYPDGDSDFLKSPEYLDYLKRFQTRQQSPAQFWRRFDGAAGDNARGFQDSVDP